MKRHSRARRPILAVLTAVVFASVLTVTGANPAGAAVSSMTREPNHSATAADCGSVSALRGNAATVSCDHDPSQTSRRWQFRVMSSTAITSVGEAIGGDEEVNDHSSVTKGSSMYSPGPLGSAGTYYTVLTVNPGCIDDGDYRIAVNPSGDGPTVILTLSIDCDADIIVTPTATTVHGSAVRNRAASQNVTSVAVAVKGTVGAMSTCSSTETVASTSGGSGTLDSTVTGSGTNRTLNITISGTADQTGQRAWNVRVNCAWRGTSATATVRVNVAITTNLTSIAVASLDTAPDEQSPGDTYSDTFWASAIRNRPTCTAADTNGHTTINITNSVSNRITSKVVFSIRSTVATVASVTITCTATNGGIDGQTVRYSTVLTIEWVDETPTLTVSVANGEADLNGANSVTASTDATVSTTDATCTVARTGGTISGVTPAIASSGNTRAVTFTATTTGTLNVRVTCNQSGSTATDTATITVIDSGGQVVSPVLITDLQNAPPDELTNRYEDEFTTTPANATCSVSKRSGVGTWSLVSSGRTVRVDSTADGDSEGQLSCSATDRATTRITIRLTFSDPTDPDDPDDDVGSANEVAINGLQATVTGRSIGSTWNDSFSTVPSSTATTTCTAAKISGPGTFSLSSARNLRVVSSGVSGTVIGTVTCSADDHESISLNVSVEFRLTSNPICNQASGWNWLSKTTPCTRRHLNPPADFDPSTDTSYTLGPPETRAIDIYHETSDRTVTCSVSRRSGVSTSVINLRLYNRRTSDFDGNGRADTTKYDVDITVTGDGEAIWRYSCGSAGYVEYRYVSSGDFVSSEHQITGFATASVRVPEGGSGTASDDITVTPGTLTCSADDIGGSLDITPRVTGTGSTRTVTASSTETGTLAVRVTCGTATASQTFTFLPPGESISGLADATGHIGRGQASATATDAFTVSPSTLNCGATRTGGTLNLNPSVTGSGANRTVSITSTEAGTVTFTVTCGNVEITGVTFTFTAADAPTTTVTVASQAKPLSGRSTTITVPYTVDPVSASCAVSVTGGTLQSSVTPRLDSHVNGGVYTYLTATSSTAGTLEMRLTCADATADATFTWTAADTPAVTISGLQSADATLHGGRASITVPVIVTPENTRCTTVRTGGTVTGVTPTFVTHVNGGIFHFVTASVVAAGTIDFRLECGAASATATFRFDPEPVPTPTISGLANRTAILSDGIATATTTFTVTPYTECTVSSTGGTLQGTVTPAISAFVNGGIHPYITAQSSTAGDLTFAVACGTATASATFTFESGPDSIVRITAFPDRRGLTGERLASTVAVTPYRDCTLTVTGGTLRNTVTPTLNAYINGGIHPYVTAESSTAGTLTMRVTCGGVTDTATFTWRSPSTNPTVTWQGGTVKGTAGSTIRSLYNVNPFSTACTIGTVTGTAADGSASLAFNVTRDSAVILPLRYVEITATGAGTAIVPLSCGATTVTRTFEFDAATGTVQNPELDWTVAPATLNGTVGTPIRTTYTVTPTGTPCTVTTTGDGDWQGTAKPVFDLVGQGLVSLTIRYVEVTATAAGAVDVLLDCSGANTRTDDNSETRIFTFDLATAQMPNITGFDPQHTLLRQGTTVVLASFTVSPLVDCDVAGIAWTDSSGTTTSNPASGAVAEIRFGVVDFSSGFNYITAVEIRNTDAVGTLRLRLTCGQTHRDATFTFKAPPRTIMTAGTASGRAGQELLIGYTTSPPGDAAGCRARDVTPDQPPVGYTDLSGTVTPAVRVVSTGTTALTVVAASSSTVGDLTVTLTCGTAPLTYPTTLKFEWSTREPGTSAVSGFADQSGATGRELETLFTTTPRELAVGCTVAIATQDSGDNPVVLVDNIDDRNAITGAKVTVTQPRPIHLSSGDYVWHLVSAVSDTAGVAELQLTCDGNDTGAATFTWYEPGTEESGTTAIVGLRSTHSGVLAVPAGQNVPETLWLADAFATSPPGGTCTASSGTTLYTARLYSIRDLNGDSDVDDDGETPTIEPWIADEISSQYTASEFDGNGEHLLVVAFISHIEAEITVTCSGGGSRTVRWGARRTASETATGRPVTVTGLVTDQVGTLGTNGMLTLQDDFTVDPDDAVCVTEGGNVYTEATVADIGDDEDRRLTMKFGRAVVSDVVVACSADEHDTTRISARWRARHRTTTLADPPAAPCAATETQDFTSSGSTLSVRGVPCVVTLVVGIEKIVFYSVLPFDTWCRWTKLATPAVRAWSIPENLTVGYSTRGGSRYLRFKASEPGYWQLRGQCTVTVVTDIGDLGTFTYEATGQVRAVADPNPAIELPSFGGFGGGAQSFTWWDAANRLADCFDPSVAERARYEEARHAYTALLRELDIDFGYWHWDSFQRQLDGLDTDDLRRVEAAYLAVGAAQDSYLVVTDGEGWLSSALRWIPFVGNDLSQLGIVSNIWEYIKRMPAGFGCVAWRLMVPDTRDAVNVLAWSMGNRGQGCRGGDGPIEACDEGGLLTWPIEAFNDAHADRDSPGSCEGPDLGAIELTTGYDTRGMPITAKVGIGSALGWALQLGANDPDVSGTVNVRTLLTGTPGDGSTSDTVPVHATRTAAEQAVADGSDPWGYYLDARGEPRSVAIDQAFGGHWFSTCDGLHSDSDISDGPGVWDRLWAIAVFSAALHALVLLVMGLLLFRATRLLLREIGRGSGGDRGSTP